MRQLLIINPNTSAHVTELLQTHGQTVAGPHVAVRTVTAHFGAPYISCEASYAVAGHALLDAWAFALSPGSIAPDAVLIGCFGDPGLLALRETSEVPITGLAEAAFTQAAIHGQFAVVTGGERWKPMLARLAHTLGFVDALAGIHVVAPTGAQLAGNRPAAVALLTQACLEAAQHYKAQSIIIGGAGLAGLAAEIQPYIDIPLIDSVQAGVHHALHQAKLSGAPVPTGRFDVLWQGLSPHLTARGLTPA